MNKSCGRDHKPVATVRQIRARSFPGGLDSATLKLSNCERNVLMKGTVVHHEHRIGFLVIRDDKGEFALAELLGNYDVEMGDIVSGNLHTNGKETLFNQTQNEAMEVSVKGYGLSEQDAISMLLRTH
jgi:hypothetical protein